MEYFPFTGFIGDNVPQVAHLFLANSVNPAKALFQSIGVPWQVIVDHQVGVLQVDTFTRSVGGNEHQHCGVTAKLTLDFTPLITVGSAVNHSDSI